MRSLVLTDHFKCGGAERVASLLINGLSTDEDNEVHVCVFEDTNRYGVDKGRVFYHLLVKKNRIGIIDNLSKIWNLTKVMRKVNPEIIYSFGPIMASYVIIAAWLSGIRRRVRIVSSERNDPRREPVSDWKKIARDKAYNASDVVVCQTPMALELLKKRGIKSKFVIIPNPISPNLPKWHGEESKDIITAARLTEQKNLPLLISAFGRVYKEYPDYRLIIYGEGELMGELHNLIDSRNLNDVVLMPGFANNISEIMAGAYMYVSSSDYEGISNSMLEALAIGLPCVCTDCPVGGAAMYIKNNVSGLLTRVMDEEGLYSAMKRLIIDKDLAISISKESRKALKDLTVDNITKRWVEL